MTTPEYIFGLNLTTSFLASPPSRQSKVPPSAAGLTIEAPVVQRTPEEAFFVEDAVIAAPPSVQANYSRSVVERATRKVAIMARASVILSMLDSTTKAANKPEFAPYEDLKLEDTPGTTLSRRPVTDLEAEDQPYAPVFEDDEQSDEATQQLIDEAIEREVARQRGQAAARRAEEAVRQLAASLTPAQNEAYAAQESAAKTAAIQHVRVELEQATTPVLLGRRETAFVEEALRTYDPLQYRDGLSKDLYCSKEAQALRPVARIGSLAVDRLTGHVAHHSKIAIRLARLVARAGVIMAVDEFMHRLRS